MKVDDITDAGVFQASLEVRGKEKHPDQFLNKTMFYNWKCVGSLTPLKRSKITPKLDRMGIPTTMLQKLTSTSLMEILWLVCRILYNCNIQGQSLPTTFLKVTGMWL